MNNSDQTRFLEIFAVILTGLGKFVLMDWLDLRLLYISLACLGWLGYVIYRTKKEPEVLVEWGFSRKEFKSLFLTLLPVFLISSIVFIGIGYWQNTLIISWHILPILLIYPIWGVIQQFLVVALIGGNLKEQTQINLPDWVTILLTAIIFAVVHFPFINLVFGTFLLALVYTFIYLRKKNLWVLGIYHGWLGAVFFFTIMDRDPWVEVFGKLGM